jgi:hypothetical protein
MSIQGYETMLTEDEKLPIKWLALEVRCGPLQQLLAQLIWRYFKQNE